MKKSIIISIKPEWVEKILNGEKTIEIRKSMPKCEFPINVYVYCCKSNDYLLDYGILKGKKEWFNWDKKSHHYPFSYYEQEFGEKMEESFNGKVLAKFTLNKVIDVIPYKKIKGERLFINYLSNCGDVNWGNKTCLGQLDFKNYLGLNNGYGWCIDNLEIFDKPMELSEFYKGNYEQIIDHLDIVGCDSVYCPYLKDEGCDIMYCPSLKIKKAPQSWCYAYKEEKQ